MRYFTFVVALILFFYGCSNKTVKKADTLTPKQKRNVVINKNIETIEKLNGTVTDSLLFSIFDKYVANNERAKAFKFLGKYYNRAKSDSIVKILAKGNLQMKNLNKALKFYKILKSKYSKNKFYSDKIYKIISLKGRVSLYYENGMKLFNNKEYRKAINKFKRATLIQKDDNNLNYRLYSSRGLLFLTKGTQTYIKNAIENFDKAISLNPSYGETYYYNSMAYFSKTKKDYKVIDAYFRKALSHNLTPSMKLKITEKYNEFKSLGKKP